MFDLKGHCTDEDTKASSRREEKHKRQPQFLHFMDVKSPAWYKITTICSQAQTIDAPFSSASPQEERQGLQKVAASDRDSPLNQDEWGNHPNKHILDKKEKEGSDIACEQKLGGHTATQITPCTTLGTTV
ncbi:hypothetical protein GH733_003145 [Mirounga leonina]|nr:hypothetical protein GH733_003145 [Mirounga leonina]